MTTTASKLMTADELLKLPKGDGRRFELIRGVLIEKMPGGKRQGLVGSRIDRIVGNYAEDNDYGDVLSIDTGYRLDSDPRHSARARRGLVRAWTPARRRYGISRNRSRPSH